MNYVLSWYLGLSHGLRGGRSNRVNRLSASVKGRASGPSGYFAQPRLIGYSGSVDLPRADRLFTIEDLPASSLRPLPPPRLLLRRRRLLAPSSSVFFQPISRRSLDSSNRSASCHTIDDDSTLSLVENRVNRTSRERKRSAGCCETFSVTLAETSQTVKSAFERC